MSAPLCPICTQECIGFKEHGVVFGMRREVKPIPADAILAPTRIIDEELERIVYSPGAVMTVDDAIKYGVISPDDERAKKAGGNTAKKPAQNRQRQQGGNR